MTTQTDRPAWTRGTSVGVGFCLLGLAGIFRLALTTDSQPRAAEVIGWLMLGALAAAAIVFALVGVSLVVEVTVRRLLTEAGLLPRSTD
ncbi:hypothetical protein CLV56_0752 [Mumia flava]|uniref:Uncharacterized protein n=1 Tax=Mumia flava TaxID=1348852 RepID=A0A0B2BPT1_9ACTN|nr:hypothetical protein [Mumia flava]PJJ56543.1 hypothetical protein CLV56_0752 [Mumia flava]